MELRRDAGEGEDLAAIEAPIREAARAGDVDRATRLALERYGPELLRFLLSWHRDETAASDVFAIVAEAIWKKIGAFTWERPLRAWAFAIARRASLHYRRDAGRRRGAPLDSRVADIAAEARTATKSFLKTERKSRLDAIRAELPPEDRALLFLRLDRKLEWNDLAIAMHEEEDAVLADADVKREAARLRKRFQLLKDKLRKRAEEEGLLGSRED